MFGHGQIEGYREKYGMEFKKSYWNEYPNQELILRHEKDIFPLLHKRYLFSEVKNFYFFNYVTNDGHVNENVFAYTNRVADEKAIIIYNNCYLQTSGWIKQSEPVRQITENLISSSLINALEINKNERFFLIFRDQVTGLEYIRANKTLHDDGFFTQLNGYQYHAFVEFREIEDFDGLYCEVCNFLNGKGVPGIEEVIQQILVKSVHLALKKNYNQQLISDFYELETLNQNLDLYRNNHKDFLSSIKDYLNLNFSLNSTIREFDTTIKIYQFLISSKSKFEYLEKIQTKIIKNLKIPDNQLIFFAWLLLQGIGTVHSKEDWEKQSRSMIDELFLNKIIDEVQLPKQNLDSGSLCNIVMILTEYQRWFEKIKGLDISWKEQIKLFLSDFNVRSFVNINRYNDVLWFNKESMYILIEWLETVACFNIMKVNYPSMENISSELKQLYEIIAFIYNGIENSEYKLHKFLDYLPDEKM